MSQPAVAALAPLPFELVLDDGDRLESNWHRIQMGLFIELTRQAMAERQRTDFFVGANMFVYFSYEQAREIAADPVGHKQFRGPDIFFVKDVPWRPGRQVWVVWEEGGRYPDLIVELLSPSTMRKDRTVKKDFYARQFRTPEYYLYRLETQTLEAFRLAGSEYQLVLPNAAGRFWSEEMGLEIGPWKGWIEDQEATWIRLFDRDGRMIPTKEEIAEAAHRRAEAAEAELARLRARLGEDG